ncbi:MAG: hypothetical protein AB7N76_06855 [Planctomycetota bacterium]
MAEVPAPAESVEAAAESARDLEPGPWIVSRGVDLAMLGVPAVFTALALLGVLYLPPVTDVPLWAFLFLIVAFDVAHVWATIYLSYLDPRALERRRLLFLLPIPLTVYLGFRLHLEAPWLFWTVLAYVAIHHFVSQQWGFIALYKLRAGERDPLDRYLDKWTLYAGAFGPVLWWHTTEQRFDWFGHGEQFLFRLPESLRGEIRLMMLAFALVWIARQVQHARVGALNWGKTLWMVASWVSWSLGIYMVAHPLVSLACVNLLHGIPFLVLVWWRLNRYWRRERDPQARAGSRLVAWLSGTEETPAPTGGAAAGGSPWPRRLAVLAAFYLPLLALGLAEEGAWERFVWGNYLPAVDGLSRAQVSLIVALLATPQVVHYYLDAWLWKLDGTNPDFEVALGLPPRPPR